MERALPACLVEDMDEDMAHKANAFPDALLVDLVGGSFKGPVDEERSPNDVLAGDEAPVAAIETFGAVVAHGEDLAGRYDKIAVDDVAGKFVGPTGGDIAIVVGWNCGKVVAVGVEGVLRVTVGGRHAGVRLVLGDSVEVDDAIAEVDVIAGDANGALDEEEIRLAGFEEDDDVAASNVAIEGKRRPLCRRSKGDAVHQNVVADEQGLHHGGRRDFEVLEDEGHHEETDGEDGADGGEGLQRGFGLLLLSGLKIVRFSFHRVGQNGSPQMQLSVYR
jgi:hypothetical protein